jgi:ubiquinone/menaquinone biosynthesis C-methylase UbiE
MSERESPGVNGQQPTANSNLEEYADPELYDIENAYDDDLPLLLRWAEAQGGPVIDLACGTGRTAIPLAEAGYQIVGVDIHGGMLARARAKARERGVTVELYEQDCADFAVPVQARLITMTGHAFQAFLTNEDQDRLLRAVYRHLTEGGVFIFDSRFPALDELTQPEEELPWRTLTDQHGCTMHEATIARYDPLAQVQHWVTIRRFGSAPGEVDEQRSNIWLRYTHPLEMRRLLDQHGFDVVAIFGDWNQSLLAGDSYDMVVIARKTGREART